MEENEGEVFVSTSFFSRITAAQSESSGTENDYYPMVSSSCFPCADKSASTRLLPLFEKRRSSLEVLEVHVQGSVYTVSQGLSPYQRAEAPGQLVQSLHEFLEKLTSIPWVTCRSGFRPISREFGTGKIFTYNSDVWWGCPLRTGQMLMLNTLKNHLYLRLTSEIELLELVQDNRLNSPFSLHKFCEKGLQEGIKPGGYYSPTSVSIIIHSLLLDSPISGLTSKVFRDGLVFKDQVIALATEMPLSYVRKACLCPQSQEELIDLHCSTCNKEPNYFEWKNSVFAIITLKYWTAQDGLHALLQKLLDMPECMGIIEGKAKESVFIVGYVDDNFLVLDPHYVQKACCDRNDIIKKLHTYQCANPLLLPFDKVDAIMSIGFLFKNMKSFTQFETKVRDSHILVQTESPDIEQSDEEYDLI